MREKFITIWVILYLSSYLTYFETFFARCFYFWFAENLIVGLAIGGMMFRGVDVIIGFFGKSL